MSSEISLLFKINSLFRIHGIFEKASVHIAVFELAGFESASKLKKFPVFSL
jgi:hypothetical protein